MAIHSMDGRDGESINRRWDDNSTGWQEKDGQSTDRVTEQGWQFGGLDDRARMAIRWDDRARMAI